MEGLTLVHAERGRKLRITGFSGHLCEYSNTQLGNLGLDEGVKVEIIPDYVSDVLVENEDGQQQLLGYEHAMELMVGDRRLTELKVGESGTVTAYEGGYHDKLSFELLGLRENSKVKLLAYKPCHGREKLELHTAHFLHPDVVPGDIYVLVEGLRKVGLPAVSYIMVKTDEGEKQLPLMKKGEEGVITRMAYYEGDKDRFDELWLKPGSHVKLIYVMEVQKIPLRVLVGSEEHVIGKGVADKIFVEYV